MLEEERLVIVDDEPRDPLDGVGARGRDGHRRSPEESTVVELPVDLFRSAPDNLHSSVWGRASGQDRPILGRPFAQHCWPPPLTWQSRDGHATAAVCVARFIWLPRADSGCAL